MVSPMLGMTSGGQLCFFNMTSLDPQLTLWSNTTASHLGSSLLITGMTCGWATSEATLTVGSTQLSTQAKINVSIPLMFYLLILLFLRLLGLYHWRDGSLWLARYADSCSGRDYRGWPNVRRSWGGDHSFLGHVPLQTRSLSEVIIVT